MSDPSPKGSRTPDGPGPPLKGGRRGPDHLRVDLGTTLGPLQDQDHSDALRRELDERFAESMARHQMRHAVADFERTQKARARTLGLRKRHQAKLAYLKEKP